MTKVRLSATVDSEWIEAAELAVASGDADSVSAWVNDALAQKAAHSRRMQALDRYISEYEAEFGVITEAEMKDAARSARERAIAVRGDRRRRERRQPTAAT